ncbi:hypothetical protein I6A84_20920 [Frankia sp. CNm7]|uniref:Tetratricopeptide repeat protein n=1 Tax=Frankia nepalensis TaxID=1836974 RepID=A0A937UPS5_9ACTN|nr:hypothetical protein [Frankia nepalensis]MBL7495674.1 hypothetical protein [Frankia nepalensis]MBL7510260.1 hypothetical protein [Frankia nepalensis]MBL7520484.1 hypothetical protein [Frankia nepalensis]MBL7631169.1 hypothetical protein [Frankia nepalensis]
MAGEIAAVTGDMAASMSYFDSAEALFQAGDHDADAPYVVLDRFDLARWRGAALARLGDEDAISSLHYALVGMDPGHLRAGAQLNVDLAHSLVAAGHVDEALRVLGTARDLAGRAGSARQLRRIRNLGLRLGHHAREHGQEAHQGS